MGKVYNDFCRVILLLGKWYFSLERVFLLCVIDTANFGNLTEIDVISIESLEVCSA